MSRLWDRLCLLWWRLVGAPEPNLGGSAPTDPTAPGIGDRPYDPRFPVS